VLGWALGTPGGAVGTVRAEIEIDAPAERIFDTLTDLGAYPEWNPFTVGVESMLRLAADVVLLGRNAE